MWLRVETGPDAGKAVRIDGESFVVGRARGCDFVVAGEGVDRRHACFEAVGPGRYAVRDLGAERGTFVAGSRIRGPVELHGHEQLCFGDTFAQLLRARPAARKRNRRVLAVAAGATAVVAAAGATAGVLAPRTGGGPTEAVHHAAASPQTPDPAAATVEPPAVPTVPDEAEPPAAPPPPVAEASGNGATVFREDFSDAGSGWEVFSTPTVAAGYSRGSYEIRIDDATWYATVDSGRRFESPTIAVDVDNPGRAAFAGVGLLCNYRNENQFDVLAIGTDGTVAILSRRGSGLEVVSEGGRWTKSARVPVGAERYRLRADCKDRLLRLWVNGEPVASARSEAPGGSIGLFAAGLAEFRFDDLVARSRA